MGGTENVFTVVGEDARWPDLLDGDSPLGGTGEMGGARTVRAARAALGIAEGAAGAAEGGGRPHDGHRVAAQDPAPAADLFVEGPVRPEELSALHRVYQQVPGQADLRRRLERTRFLVLCGDHGTGRASAALALLAELADGRVTRIAPATGLGPHGAGALEKGHGYLLELSDEDAHAAQEPRIDRLHDVLAQREAYGVVLLPRGDLADRLLRGRRHALAHRPPAADRVLDRHLVALLADEPDAVLAAARATAADPGVRRALGLDEPLPGEAARLAGLLAGHVSGRLSRERLLGHCRDLAPLQARTWFAAADRPGTLPEALPALRAAALRIALAVFNGAAHSIVAEAAELLAWELAVTLDPLYAPGRPLFAASAEDRLAAARAVLEDGTEEIGDTSVPVRVARFRGAALAPAVLYEAWDGHHNVRGPMARWLRALCDDPRPPVWVRAAVAAGALSARDHLYGLAELLLPLARTDSAVQRMAAATALAEASRAPGVRPAVEGLLRGWARGGDERTRETAVLAHGYGLVAGSVSASLDELGRIDCPDGGLVASYSVLRLLAGPEPDTVLARLAHWLRDARRSRQDLALMTVVRAMSTRTSRLWGPPAAPEPAPRARWPLATALLAARPEREEPLAELIVAALTRARTAPAAQESLVGWIREATGDEGQLVVLCGFLPRLAGEGDGPLGGRVAARIREVLEAL